jgi:hypothetical protein
MDPDLEIVKLVGSALIIQDPSPWPFNARICTLKFRHLNKIKVVPYSLHGDFGIFLK